MHDRSDGEGARIDCAELAAVRYCCYCGSPAVQIDVADSCMHCRGCGRKLYFNSKPAVAAVILRDSQVLLVSDSVREGVWDFPGGFLLYGESPEDGLRREVREELAAEIEVGELLAAVLDRYGPDSACSLNLFYRANLLSDRLESRSEIESHGWFDIRQLPSVKYKSTSGILARL